MAISFSSKSDNILPFLYQECHSCDAFRLQLFDWRCLAINKTRSFCQVRSICIPENWQRFLTGMEMFEHLQLTRSVFGGVEQSGGSKDAEASRCRFFNHLSLAGLPSLSCAT